MTDQDYKDVDRCKVTADPPLETFEIPDDIFDKKPFCLRYEKEDDSCIHDGSAGEDSDYYEPTKEYLASDVGPFKVTGIIHCYAPMGVIKNNVRIIIPTCNPLINTCNGGGRNRVDKLTTEARVWWRFKNSRKVKDACLNFYLSGSYAYEELGWTVHFCKPAMMRHDGTTQAWPTCDPFQKECNGGKSPETILAQRREWGCFNALKRAQVGYHGISFEDWVKVKFGDVQLNTQIEVQCRDEWAKVKFAHMENLCSNPMIDQAFWKNASTNKDNKNGHDCPNH
jgi:hypothetical protein